MNGQIPLSGAGNTLCKLTFPPSRAGAARVSYDFPAESGISGAAKDKHKFPRSEPDFQEVSIGKWNAHREGAVDAKSNRLGQPRANVMQKAGSQSPCFFCRNDVAYTSDAGARWRESKLTESITSPTQRILSVHFSKRMRLRKS